MPLKPERPLKPCCQDPAAAQGPGAPAYSGAGGAKGATERGAKGATRGGAAAVPDAKGGAPPEGHGPCRADVADAGAMAAHLHAAAPAGHAGAHA